MIYILGTISGSASLPSLPMVPAPQCSSGGPFSGSVTETRLTKSWGAEAGMSSVPPQAVALWLQGSFSITAIDEKACCPHWQGGTIRWGGVSLEQPRAPSASTWDGLWGKEPS